MITHLKEKIDRRLARAQRRAARKNSYGKRSARVRPQNMTNRMKYILDVAGPQELGQFIADRVK